MQFSAGGTQQCFLHQELFSALQHDDPDPDTSLDSPHLIFIAVSTDASTRLKTQECNSRTSASRFVFCLSTSRWNFLWMVLLVVSIVHVNCGGDEEESESD